MQNSTRASSSIALPTSPIDLAIVGGGAAGLSAALVAGSARLSTVVLDAGLPRNRFAHRLSSYLGADGVDPAELLARGRRELETYGVPVIPATVVSITGEMGAFMLTTEAGDTVQAARVIVATGLTDRLADIPGLAELWGSKVFHCPFCHGWEVRDQTVVSIATVPGATHAAILLPQWGAQVTYVTNGFELSGDERATLTSRGVTIVDDRATRVEQIGDGTRVTLENGEPLDSDWVHAASAVEPNDHLVHQFGLETAANPMVGVDFVVVDGDGATSVPGLFVAGNASDMGSQVILAAAAGYRSAMAAIRGKIMSDVAAGLAQATPAT
ncbi:NAD(P)/FAD-dependent oxidoreductase [Frigoribacterium sp. 2-23]|uniref:NAD(P)/FAD-dependent oxidoreductase n=1 Tax=Frigoribacterium sp. 2-23 TaxID=3415006 RepID=UPI003C6EF063